MFRIRRKRKPNVAFSLNETDSFEAMHRQLVRSILYTVRFMPKYQRLVESFKAKISEAELLVITPLLKLELTPSLQELVSHAQLYRLITQAEARELLDGNAIALETTGKEA